MKGFWFWSFLCVDKYKNIIGFNIKNNKYGEYVKNIDVLVV